MIDLTPAQLRLIKDAQNREDCVVSFYGQRETTKQKLLDGGLVETVWTLTDEERAAKRAEVAEACNELRQAIFTDASAVRLGRIARSISNGTSKLFYTKEILTDLGKTV